MICPKCKTEVSEKHTVCPNCNLRLIFKCPRCGEPTRLGSASCKKCGFTFVKFCPKCGSANYSSSSVCRKCGKEFNSDNTQSVDEVLKNGKPNKRTRNMLHKVTELSSSSSKDRFELQKTQQQKTEPKAQPIQKEDPPVNKQSQKPKSQEQKKEAIKQQETKEEQPLLFYIDFVNLETTFEKFDDGEFKQKVVQNIKTTVKIAFGQDCDFINAHTVMFKFFYNKSVKLLDKVEIFEKEFSRFNQILEKTLDTGLAYKFAISTIDEVRKNKEVNQLKFGSEKDIIVSTGTYARLNSEMSLIKVSPDSYKMIFLDKKPTFEQSNTEKYEKALDTILTNLSEPNSPIRAISVNAGRGVGKTHLLTEVYNRAKSLNLNNTLIFYAQCSALTQISPYGLIQNFFMSLFECPNILKGEFNTKVFEKKVLDKLNINKISPDALETLANLIYPIKKDNFEKILINKQYTLEYLKEIFEQIKHKKNIIFIVDDFDLIDESSYSFLKYLVEADYFDHDAKIILGYKNEHSISVYFQSNKNKFNNANCLNISLRSFSVVECKDFIKKVLGEKSAVPDEILSQIAYNAQGNIAYIEQILQYMFEQKIFYFNNDTVKFKIDKTDFEMPTTMETCFCKRLEYLKEQNEKEYIFLTTASLLGDRVDYKTLAAVFKLNQDEFFEIVKKLEKKGYLKPKADSIYGFKNSLTWSYCYIKAKEEPLIKNDVKNLLLELNDKIISTPLICPVLAQIIDNKDLAFSLWTKNLQYANYIGDTNIYAMAQKQSLILLESVKLDNFEYTKNNICERLGKLIYEKNPAEAKDYLAYAVASAQKNDDENKVIDLSGYLIKSAYLIQDYTGVKEIVDNVLKYFDNKDKSEKKSTVDLQNALIKTKKLDALLYMGAWEEINNTVNNEINPVLEKNLKLFYNHKWINQSEIYDIHIKSNIILAQSYAQQGSPLATDLIKELDKEINKTKTKSYDTLKVLLLYAMAMYYTSKGYFTDSELVLQDILKEYSYVIDKPELVCKWNIINLINKILKGEGKSIRQNLFEATTYANNCNDEVSKNLLKTLLAYVFLEEKTYFKAIEIATAQMQFFSERKLAFGAMLSWYISVAATVQTKADMYCIEICEKAVKICENAQNNNYYFKILFQELLSRAYLKLNDKDNAKMYCDLALQSANMNELVYLQIRLNDLKAELARECLASQPDKTKYEYAMNVIKLYENTINHAKMLDLKYYIEKLNKDLTSFKAHCQLNRIIEDK